MKSTLCLLAIVLISSMSLTPLAASSQASPNTPVSINQLEFFASVPSHMTVGENYTIRVSVTSSVARVLPLIVTFNTPTGYMVANPLEQDFLLSPNGSITLLFFVVPYTNHQGALGITVDLFDSNASSTHGPLMIQSLTANVYSIDQPTTPLLLVLVGLVAAGACIGVYAVLRRQRAPSATLSSNE